jgi:hypothetical protein
MSIATSQIRMVKKGDNMKRTGLGGILMLLLCLGLISVEARGDDLQRFLAQLQSEAASKPAANWLTTSSGVTRAKESSAAACYAYVDCPDGVNHVSCEGDEECESRPDVCWVRCDGVFHSCPLCW